ncbi:release factor glutamine methyltransferase [Pedobacter sp. UYEF25]
MNQNQLNRLFKQELIALYTESEIKVFLSLTLEKYLASPNFKLDNEKNLALSEGLTNKFKDILAELKIHRPIQYILNQAHFFGLLFEVNQYVLIPRPETEELVFWMLQDFKAKKREQIKVLDVGTGSGCIAISLKKNFSFIQMSAIDISAGALEVAKANALINKVDINFIEDDILTSTAITRYDVIVSNPPYVRKLEMSDMEKNVIDFEPHLALFVEDDAPLKFYSAIADFALRNLNPTGTLYLEINEFLSKQTVELLDHKLFTNIELRKDMQGKDRMIKANLP